MSLEHDALILCIVAMFGRHLTSLNEVTLLDVHQIKTFCLRNKPSGILLFSP